MIVTEEIFICVLDFEATCEDQSPIHEVIEFPSVLYKWTIKYNKKNPMYIIESKVEIISEFQQFVKPKNDPVLSEFCKNLTHITQESVDNGLPFPTVLDNHYKWLQSHIPYFAHQDVFIMTCGDWDLKTMAPIEYRNYEMKAVPSIYLQWINIKNEFFFHFRTDRNIRSNVRGLAGMVEYLGMEFVGQPHSGIDDCRNIGRVFEKLVSQGYLLRDHHSFRSIYYDGH
jgi:inhibitor of KinA sporulation pathway (predicted exonuclease)